MSEIYLWIFLLITFASIGGWAFYVIYRLTLHTNRDISSSKATFFNMVRIFNIMKKAIFTTRQDFLDLKTEVQMQKFDSARIIEWLDKEEKRRTALNEEIIKSLKITERESHIIEISERLKLISTKKR